MKLAVYLETTAVLFGSRGKREPGDSHATGRDAPLVGERHKYDLFVSEAVENECRRGDPLQARKRLSLIEEGFHAPSESGHNGTGGEVGNSWRVAGGRYQIDYLATWNIRHIANAQIRRITEGILEDNGYRRPIVCTPEELFGVDALEG